MAPQPESYRGRVNCFGPRACYEESKRLAETLVWEHLRRGVDARVARIFNTFGPRLDPADGRVVPSFIVRALRGLPLPVHGDGLQTRTLLYVDDLVDGLLRLASDAAAAGTLVNLGGETELRVLELGRLICRLAGVACRLEHRPAAPDDPRRRRPDLERARALLRWSPRTPVDEGLLRTIAWFRSTTDLPHQAP